MTYRDHRWLVRFVRTGLAALTVGTVAFTAGCGGGDDSGSGSEVGARSDIDTTDDAGAADPPPSDDVAGDTGGGVSAQEFCGAYLGIGIDPVEHPIAFGERAAELTPPAEITDDWESLVEGNTAAAEDITMWMIANCPQMNG